LFGKERRDKHIIVNMFGTIVPDRQRYSFVVPEVCDWSVGKIKRMVPEQVSDVVEIRMRKQFC
jgi:hypothetical protein